MGESLSSRVRAAKRRLPRTSRSDEGDLLSAGRRATFGRGVATHCGCSRIWHNGYGLYGHCHGLNGSSRMSVLLTVRLVRHGRRVQDPYHPLKFPYNPYPYPIHRNWRRAQSLPPNTRPLLGSIPPALRVRNDVVRSPTPSFQPSRLRDGTAKSIHT